MGRKFFAWLLLAGGLLLLISGSREYIESWWSQNKLAEEPHQSEAPLHQPPATTPAPQPEQPSFQRGDVVAGLTIPRLNTKLSVLEGVGKKELRRGPGHMIGTALPGQADNMIIAGHRDTHFRVLKDIREGDEIVFSYQGERVTYRVRKTEIVMPTATRVLQPTREARLTLITCYPFYYVGSAPKRFIVEAELAGRTPLQTAHKDAPLSPITP